MLTPEFIVQLVIVLVLLYMASYPLFEHFRYLALVKREKELLDASELLRHYLKNCTGIVATTILDNQIYVLAKYEESLKFIPSKLNNVKITVILEKFNAN